MNSDIKPDFEKLADQWYIDWDNDHKGMKEMSVDLMNKIWTDHVEPLLSTVKRLQEENEQLKEALDHLTANGGFLQAVAASSKNSLLMEWYMSFHINRKAYILRGKD